LQFVEGGAGSRRPRLHFDHVQIAVEDLGAAAERFRVDHGLFSIPGGRHPGRGTANALIPLGESYLELIAVADAAEAEAFPSSLRVKRAIDTGRTFAAWAARTDDLEATKRYLEKEGLELGAIVGGRRQRPDGQELTWRSLELAKDGAFSPLPFLIEWQVPPELFPGAASVDHPNGARSVESVVLAAGGPEPTWDILQRLLAGPVSYQLRPGEPGVLEMVLGTPTGPLPLS
jgi:Glyoxalase-like domain